MNRRGSVRASSLRKRPRARVGCQAGVVCGVLVLLMTMGCISRRVGDLDAYENIAMSRVDPYPEQNEMQKRAYEIVVVDRDSGGIDESLLAQPRAQVRRALEGVASEAGATVIDQSLQIERQIPTEERVPELDGVGAESRPGADLALATRFSTYRYSVDWKPPFKFLWQTQEDIAEKQGSCTHHVEIELDIQVVEIGLNDRISRTFTLEHTADEANKDLDPGCTIAPVAKAVMFENALDDALSCLELPLGTLLSPRGHVTAHKKERGGDSHIYRVSLGATHGIHPGDRIEIRRLERSMSPTGEEGRFETVIAGGVVTDQVQAKRSWVAIDPTKAISEILNGDIVRPVRTEGLLSSLSGPKCGQILQER